MTGSSQKVKKFSLSPLKISPEAILESSYDGIWITDGKGYVVYTNEAWERITGISREEVIGKATEELLEKKLFSDSVTLSVLDNKKRVTMMLYNYKTNKQTLTTGNPIFDKDGNIEYIVNNVRDITDLTTLKEKLEKKDQLIDLQNTELSHLRTKLSLHNDLVFTSHEMNQIIDLAVRVASFDCTVLVQGESGVGKGIITKAIVKNSTRKDGPFVKIDCGAIPANLLESELFGYEKGAFTGADSKGKKGMFELANKGTVFLDEIGELPLSLQVKLLHAIQEKEIKRVGGTNPIPLDIRIIAATNKNLEEMVSKGEFREDLFFRLNVVTLTIPPLRQRAEDIPILCSHFLKHYNQKHAQNKSLSHETISFLINYSWPGNVRELQNLMENLVIITPDQLIRPKHLPEKMRAECNNSQSQIEINGIVPLKNAVRILEETLIQKAMTKYKTTRKAAAALGINQSTLVKKYQTLGIKFDRRPGLDEQE
ncbi:MAG: sigma-54 interaction domain-containing protein [Bacillota bacterium]